MTLNPLSHLGVHCLTCLPADLVTIAYKSPAPHGQRSPSRNVNRLMKTIRYLCLILSMALALSGSAQANSWHHQHGGHHSHHRHHHGGDWGSTAALLAITGVAVGATIYRQSPPPPAYIPPPRVIYAPPADPGIWYFCRSAGQYYPYVRHCYEGWEAVIPPPPR